jgi:hypothetical protein
MWSSSTYIVAQALFETQNIPQWRYMLKEFFRLLHLFTPPRGAPLGQQPSD